MGHENKSESVRVLLVEDSPSDVRLMTEALKESSIPVSVTVARDGVEATEYLHRAEAGKVARPDLVLLDLNLPRKNGHEVLAEVKASHSLRPIPVVVLSSSRAPEDERRAYALSANCFVTKPSNLPDYVEMVHGLERMWFHPQLGRTA